MILYKSQQVTGQVTEAVERLLLALHGEMSRQQIQDTLALKHRNYFNEMFLSPALEEQLVEMTIPDKPRSSRQRYRLTEKGHRLLAQIKARKEWEQAEKLETKTVEPTASWNSVETNKPKQG